MLRTLRQQAKSASHTVIMHANKLLSCSWNVHQAGTELWPGDLLVWSTSTVAEPHSDITKVNVLQGSRPDEALDLDLALPVRSQGNQTADQEEEHQEPLYAAISSAAAQGGRPRQADPPRGLGSFLPLPKREGNPSSSGDTERCLFMNVCSHA